MFAESWRGINKNFKLFTFDRHVVNNLFIAWISFQLIYILIACQSKVIPWVLFMAWNLSLIFEELAYSFVFLINCKIWTCLYYLTLHDCFTVTKNKSNNSNDISRSNWLNGRHRCLESLRQLLHIVSFSFKGSSSY